VLVDHLDKPTTIKVPDGDTLLKLAQWDTQGQQRRAGGPRQHMPSPRAV